MRKWFKGPLGCLLAAVMAGPVVAEELVEEFPDPFGGYRDRWLFQNSNISSYYYATGNCDVNYRGNNACGIWIADCQECGCGVGGNEANIIFKPEFAASIQYVAFDLSSWNATGLKVYDKDGNVVLDVVNPVRTMNQCAGQRYEANSNNGVSRIQVLGSGQVEGNNAMDNFKVIVASGCGYKVKKSKSKGGCEACPEVGGEVFSGADCEDVKDCDKKYKKTIGCPDGGPGTCKIKGKRTSCG
ncbi:MAG: hypothetical protein C4547_12465 [Phycisphaerales bacterium]|nr:MAG: hypothetical protein C4547_12465 [Phycisphaerales bacterium]